jgi:rhodanese-related sulfurtransferase
MRIITSCLGLFFFSALFGYADDDVKIIDIVQADYLLRSGAVFIDNRPEHKFALGHIQGAVNLPFFVANHPSNRMTRENLLQAIGDKEEVVFYCTGRERAYHALKQAKQWGILVEMYWYRNGFTEWKILRNQVAD